LLEKKLFSEGEIIVTDIDAEKLKALKLRGIFTTSDNELLFKTAQIIILAVKPQVAKTLLPTLREAADGSHIVSIMAGLTKKKIKELLGDVKVTRIMPNTPCMVGEGMSAIDATEFNAEERQTVLAVFGSLGKTVLLDEAYFDAVTAVSGSGPAYVYSFIDAMIKGGVKAGLSEEISKTLTLQTFMGAVKMVEKSPLPLETLIQNVCSKGGTTIQAVEHYKNNGLERIIREGMEKCEARSKELSHD
jgi:pyrroline-5-carboxylate reductase